MHARATRAPSDAAVMAATVPAIPDPSTSTSTSRGAGGAGSTPAGDSVARAIRLVAMAVS